MGHRGLIVRVVLDLELQSSLEKKGSHPPDRVVGRLRPTAFREFWYGLVGGNSIGQGFTGNGLNGLRSFVGSGGAPLRSGKPSVIGQKTSPLEPLIARSPQPPQGTRPTFPNTEPPYQPLVPCYTQRLPNFNGPLAGPGPADGSGS